MGGLTEALQIHDLCLERDIPVWCGGMLETGIGRASNLALASLPGFTLPGDISATDRYYEVDVASPRFELNSDGTIDVPNGAGLGVVIDRTALETFTLRTKRFQDKPFTTGHRKTVSSVRDRYTTAVIGCVRLRKRVVPGSWIKSFFATFSTN